MSAMDSLVSLLSKSFKQVPLAAIPSMLDCILVSTHFSPSSLFSSLLDSFSNLVKDIVEDQKLECTHVAAMVGALCHLLKKLGTNPDALKSFIWKCFVPIIKMVHRYEHEMLGQVAETLIDVVKVTNTWNVLKETLVPLFLRLLCHSVGVFQSAEPDAYKWNLCLDWQGVNDMMNGFDSSGGSLISLSGCFSLPVLCHILALILDASVQSFCAASNQGLTFVNGNGDIEKLFGELLWDLCIMSETMLLQCLEHRSCALNFLLPAIFKSFSSHDYLEISIRGMILILSRNLFCRKIWKCCRSLFSLGPLERRDAYCVLSLYLSFTPCGEGRENANGNVAEIDLKIEREFWSEIKRGLVDEERLLRKQSIHLLKATLQLKAGSEHFTIVAEKKPLETHLIPRGMTRRELWANKEAKSLGVGKLCDYGDSQLNNLQQWEAFILLYEMLEEYGTHLVEAAWNHQVSLLLRISISNDSFASSIYGGHENKSEASCESFSWLTILWQRGLRHDNPQVRCLIMQSFLGIEWVKYREFAKSVPTSFILGPFLEGLNDYVHHKDFGVKGIYTSQTIEGAARFMHQYATSKSRRKGVALLHSLASLAKQISFGRAGLMGLAECIASVACGVRIHSDCELGWDEEQYPVEYVLDQNMNIDLLDALRFVIESSKQHFNRNYRLQVCEKVLVAAASVVKTADVRFEVLLQFISAFPREFTDYDGSLRRRTQEWLWGYENECSNSSNHCDEIKLLKSLEDFPKCFTSSQYSIGADATFDDEDLDAWNAEANRWARTLFLAVQKEHQLTPVLMYIQNCGKDCCETNSSHLSLVKFFILTVSLVEEIRTLQQNVAEHGSKMRSRLHTGRVEVLGYAEYSAVYEKLSNIIMLLLDKLVSFANICCSIFWSHVDKGTILPNSVRGKLGGPSQRRLSTLTTTCVLKAITSLQAISSILVFCAQLKSNLQLNFAWTFMWKFFWKTTTSTISDSETGCEVLLAAYEALAPILRALAFTFSSQSMNLINDLFPLTKEVKGCLDSLVLSFLQNINNLLTVGVLVRTRRAVLLNWKWLCLESLLSIPYYALRNGLHLEIGSSFFSDVAIRYIFNDLVQSLENVGENSVLAMLRSVRLALELFASGKYGSLVSSCKGVDMQMMWDLVRSSWILHVSSNKRRVECIAALLSSVLHSSVFSDESLHLDAGAPGPLKWFVERLLDGGTKSPRTIRLVALHLTGLWLSHPKIIKNYIKELKILTLYGSVAFDEDFEAELLDNPDAKIEVSLLAKSPDLELTEVFINTELYARVSVAALFNRLADLVDLAGSTNVDDCHAALESGKLFLLELLNSAVNDKDLGKELYKKYSGIHRRKVRAWQMICVLSRFVTDDIVGQVTHNLHIALCRNNLPAVRQYLETFAINIYLRFPSLVGEQLVPALLDYDMRPQTLSSYVFIAANVILHSSKVLQSIHLEALMPSIVPLLTSHHHSLRGFTQLLVFHVLCKFFSSIGYGASEAISLEKRCFENLKSYLAENPDCKRLRASMEGYLDAYNPILSRTPAGIFVNRVEELEFECVPKSLMEEVLNFLNDVREDLRTSMAEDILTIKNENLKIDDNSNYSGELSNGSLLSETFFDFQKKVTFSKHEKQDHNFSCLLGCYGTHDLLLEKEKEDELLDQSIQTRSFMMEKLRASRQPVIIVASFLDRIPNLAGLARTCEVFRTSGLAIADASILHDKQFQLISVTAEKWVPILEVPVNSVKHFLEKKKQEGFSILGLEQTTNSVPLDKYAYPKKTVLVLGREKEGIPVDIIHILDACIEIPQLGVVRSLNAHVSGAIALWEYTRQQRSQ
ncbi:hypothetical protein K2173_003643 [Erythroxylum novogranatense]|uniref:tRNA (guanosine(18)-2'-O)-methyltransferase TARBP1 n=1 Tax=Erythroxylum novogranatense TaxID=1862640 RepID=A0AAV8TBX3_9ROSI|nr:hypothetical protein K2173_003643 [Erythroxylum novogranatense]